MVKQTLSDHELDEVARLVDDLEAVSWSGRIKRLHQLVGGERDPHIIQAVTDHFRVGCFGEYTLHGPEPIGAGGSTSEMPWTECAARSTKTCVRAVTND